MPTYLCKAMLARTDRPGGAVGGLLAAKLGDDRLGDLVGRPTGVDDAQQPSAAVVVDERCGCFVEYREPVADHVPGVVAAPLDPGPRQEPGDQLLARGVEVDRGISREAFLLGQTARLAGLADRARVTVEQVTAVVGGGFHARQEQLGDQLIGYELAAVQVVTNLLAQWRAGLDLGPQQIAGGDVLDSQTLRQAFTLRYFDGTRW